MRARTLSVALLAGLLLAGCGSGRGISATDHEASPRSPAALAATRGEAGRLLGGGRDAFEARVAGLHGYPVVVNAWASWCPPCLGELPIVARVARRFGRRVAFLGLDSQDSKEGATRLIREARLPYPSYADPDGSVLAAVAPVVGLPDTAFYGPDGGLEYVRFGPYAAAGELERDLRLLLRGELAAAAG